jgi:hypothetical protein
MLQESRIGEHRRRDGKGLEVERQELRSESSEVRVECALPDLFGEAVPDERDSR